MKLNPGTEIERYVVDQAIGAGGTAMVYRVVHSKLKTAFALKVLTITSESIRKRILLEGQVQASLRHVNIVAVTDVLDVDGSPGLVMEYIEGPSLERALRRYKIAMRDAETLFLGVVSGVSHAHAHGLVHRDLKPANVLLANSANGYIPKVTDFGLAKVLQGEGADTAQTRSGIAMGTPSYMSPEQIQDARNVDQAADVFSLGCILYELVTRRRAFPGEQVLPIYNAICSGKYVDPKSLVPNLPRRLEMAIGGALMVDRDLRIPDCDTLVRVFKGQQEWAFDEDSPRNEPLSSELSEIPNIAADAPIMTISDGASQQPATQAQPRALGLLGGAEGLDPLTDPRGGVYSEPEGLSDSLSDSAEAVTLLPGGRPKSRGLPVLALVGAASLLLALVLLGAVYVAWLFGGDTLIPPEPTPVVESSPSPTPKVEVPPSPTSQPDEPTGEVANTGSTVKPSPVAPTSAVEKSESSSPVTTVSPEVQAPTPQVVKLLSMPPTARILVNGAEHGRTPAKLELPPGTYDIRISSGDSTAAFKIDVGEGSVNKWCYNFPDGRRYEGSCPR